MSNQKQSTMLCQAICKNGKPCQWKTKPKSCGRFCKIHKNYGEPPVCKPVCKPVAEEPTTEPSWLTHAGAEIERIKADEPVCDANAETRLALMSKMEQILKGVKQTKQYRDKTKKVRFNLEWSFLLGQNISALGAKSFETPHNFKKGKGVCLTPVESRKLPKWKLELWDLSKQLIQLIDPDFADGEYVVNYSCMRKAEQYVKKHVDADDISHQYALALGDYKNAKLRLYDEHDRILGDFDYDHKVCKMDGRLPHELISEGGFEGERFCVIWFKSYDHRKIEPDPIFNTPCYV